MQNQDTPIDLPTLVQEARAQRDRGVADIIATAVKRAASVARRALSGSRQAHAIHTGNARQALPSGSS